MRVGVPEACTVSFEGDGGCGLAVAESRNHCSRARRETDSTCVAAIGIGI